MGTESEFNPTEELFEWIENLDEETLVIEMFGLEPTEELEEATTPSDEDRARFLKRVDEIVTEQIEDHGMHPFAAIAGLGAFMTFANEEMSEQAADIIMDEATVQVAEIDAESLGEILGAQMMEENGEGDDDVMFQ